METSTLPEVSDEPLCAYVKRLEPESIGKTKIAGKVQGEFVGFFTPDQLEEMVTDVAGGGTFSCRVVRDAKRDQYVGYHKFLVAGPVKVNGEIVEEQKHTKGSSSKAEKIQEEIEAEQAKMEMDGIKAERERRRSMLTEGASDLNEKIEMLEQQIQSRDEKERERERWEPLKEQLRDVKLELSQLRSGGNDGGAAAQVEAIKSMVQSGQEGMRVMVQAMENNRTASQDSMTKLMEMMFAKSDSSGDQERTDKLVEKLIDAKSESVGKIMEVMKDSFSTGMMMASGKLPNEGGPTTVTDVVKTFTDRVCDIVGEYMKMKQGGQVTEEAIRSEIGSVVQEAMKQLNPTVNPAVNPAAKRLSEGQSQPPSVRKAMDKVLNTFLEDARRGQITDNWVSVAKSILPVDIVGELNRCVQKNDLKGLYALMSAHGSKNLVKEVVAHFTNLQASAMKKEQNKRPVTGRPRRPKSKAPKKDADKTTEKVAEKAAKTE
ncbi:MAG TPA: hypothetical protein ENI27_06560 [bacterium]|nr:hypothetical protein [bacterium]